MFEGYRYSDHGDKSYGWDRGYSRRGRATDENKRLSETLDRWMNTVLVNNELTADDLANTNLEDFKKTQETIKLIYELYNAYIDRCAQFDRIEDELIRLRNAVYGMRYSKHVSYSDFDRNSEDKEESNEYDND